MRKSITTMNEYDEYEYDKFEMASKLATMKRFYLEKPTQKRETRQFKE